MADEKTYTPIIKQKNIAGKLIQFEVDAPTEIWKTTYEYWLVNKNNFTGHKMGRWEKGKFFVYDKIAKDWVEDEYKNYYYTMKDSSGAPITDEKGKAKQRNYFKKYFKWKVKFTKPETFNIWDPQQKAEVPKALTEANLEVTTSLNDKIIDQITDARGGGIADIYEVSYNPKASPVEMYKVAFKMKGGDVPDTSQVTIDFEGANETEQRIINSFKDKVYEKDDMVQLFTLNGVTDNRAKELIDKLGLL